jgi:hypothetical protein
VILILQLLAQPTEYKFVWVHYNKTFVNVKLSEAQKLLESNLFLSSTIRPPWKSSQSEQVQHESCPKFSSSPQLERGPKLS